MREVAKIAGVSVSTVSAVLSGEKYVSEKLRRRVETAALQVGYAKSGARPRKAGEPRKEVGVILPGIYSAFFPPLLSGIEDAANEHGISIVLCDSDRSFKKESDFFEHLIRRGIRHVIVDSICDMAHQGEYLDRLKKTIGGDGQSTLIFLEREIEDDAFYSIFADNYAASYEAVTHLLEKGHTRIAHIGGSKLFPHTHVRAQAYKMALLEHDIPFSERLVCHGDFSPLSGFAAMNELLEKGIRFSAVFSANDQMAIGAMKAIMRHGLRIPEDIAVVGFDNLTVASLVSPGLTTVQYPIYQMGFRAMRIIIDRMRGMDRERKTRLDARLIVRRSSDGGQVDDWNLQRW